MYNKLFTKILDSSIWLEDAATRLVWITLLAAMDEDGMCQFASIGNLAHRARLNMNETAAAVECLEGPDENSSDTANDGRRIERVPGGWLVLNSEKYRNIATREHAKGKTRDRVAEFRARKRIGMDVQMKNQGGRCDCCNQPFETPYHLYVVQDHNHKTMAWRGLICQSCNKIVGQIELGQAVISGKLEICNSYIARYEELHTREQCNAKRNAEVTAAEEEAEEEADGFLFTEPEIVKPQKCSQGDFDAFWKLYPRKVGKDSARRSFLLKVKPAILKSVLDAIVAQSKTEQWTRDNGTYIPHPTTWLNQGRWKDEYNGKTATHPKTATASAASAGTSNAGRASQYR